MNKLKLIITQEAFNDLESISDYIANDNISASKNLINELFDSCDALCEFSNIGVRKECIKDKNVKFYIYKKQYFIAYKIDNDKLVVFKYTSRYQDIQNLL